MIWSLVKIFLLAIGQNIANSIVSRSRNRDNRTFHVIASLFSHSLWFLSFRELVIGEMNLLLFVPYMIGSILGSTAGVSISMRIERWMNASTDNHLKVVKQE